MKSFAVVLLAFAMGLSACSSGNTSARSDYANAGFGSANSRQQARAEEIRKLHPGLTDQQVAQQVEREFTPAAAQK